MTLLWTVFIIYAVISLFVAVVNLMDWGMKRGLRYFEEQSRDAARRVFRAHLWPLMLVDKIKELKEDAK